VECRQNSLSWSPFDGVGREVAGNGLFDFTERGLGIRGATCEFLTVVDTAIYRKSNLEKLIREIHISANAACALVSSGGIFAYLFGRAPQNVAAEAMAAAKKHGTIVSYDFGITAQVCGNRLDRRIGKAQEVNRKLMSQVDFVFGNEEDFDAALSIRVKSDAKNYQKLDT
jgi:2-dehydro-3-deoxygluconokinase